MDTVRGPDIATALDRLGELAGDADLADIAALRDRLASARLRVLVAGEAKRGKSTLINALLGRDVLPTGVTPLTAVATTVLPGDAGDIEVAFLDGHRERLPLAMLADYGGERGNPGNCRHVASITVWLDAPVLARGLEIVDTPGTGSVHEHNTAAADAALPSMDAAIFVLTADPPVSASERDLLRRVAALSVELFVVLNKADYLDAEQLAEALTFTAQVAAEVTGRPAHIYPMSARAALGPGSEAGFRAFAADFDAYLRTGRQAGLELSVTRHARRIAGQLLDEVALARRAADLPGEQAAEQIRAFRARIDDVTSHGLDAEDRANAQSRRLLAALNDAAERARPVLTAAAAEQLAALLTGELAQAPAGEIERAGRARLAAIVAEGAEAWRQEQTRALEAGLSALDDRLSAALAADLASVKSAAAELLGLDLLMPDPGAQLPASRSFFYQLDEQIDQTELLAGAVRRRLPGEYGRRVARQWLAGQVAELADAQIGRARGDLQYRLAEATRQLAAVVRGRYAGSAGRLGLALERAEGLRAAAAGERDQELAALADRANALQRVLDELPCVPAGQNADLAPANPH